MLYWNITDQCRNIPNETYKVMVIGVTGAGKSCLCNFFFRKKKFLEDHGQISVTVQSASHYQTICGATIKFIDTPGFCDDLDDNRKRVAELGEALLHAQGGVHAIVICVNGGQRFSSADGSLFEELKILGTFWPHAFIVYTNGGKMGVTEENQKDKLQSWRDHERCPHRMKELFKHVKDRHMIMECVDNKSEEYYQKKCKEFFTLVKQVDEETHHICYTNKLFEIAHHEYNKTLKCKEVEVNESFKAIEMLKHKESTTDKAMKQIAKEKNQLDRKVNEKQRTIDQLNRKVQNYKLKQQNKHKNSTTEIKSLKKQLKDANTEKLSLKKSYAEKESSLLEKEEELDEIIEERDKLLMQQEDLIVELSDKGAIVQALHQKIDNLKEKLMSMESELDKLKPKPKPKLDQNRCLIF